MTTMKNNHKHIIRMAALAILGVAMTACSAVDAEQTATTGKTVVLKGQLAPKGGDNTTRSFGWDDEKGYAQWEGNEEVAVYYQTSTGHATATAKLTDDDGSFEAELVDAVNGEVKFVYPAALHDGEGNYQTTGIALQDGTIDGLNSWDIATGQATMTVNGSEATLGGDLTLDPQVGVFRFILKDEDGFDVSPDKLEIQIGEQLAYTITPTEAGNVLYAAMLPVQNANFTFTATKGNVVYTKSSNGVTIATGKFYSGDLTLSEQTALNATDLSMVDCAGNARTDGRWTANCYMVHTAGQYKFPLVYGNAIKGGQTNEVAYKPGGTTSDTYCANFVNHANEDITAPWLKNNGVIATSAELLWQDAEGLITAVGVSGNYLTLTVGKNANEQEGNAVIAAKDKDGVVVWSWHIWVTKQTFADLTDVAATVTDNNTSYNYKVTPVNLGWVGTATSTTGYNTYYQWGRKDAFIPSTGIKDNTANHTVYDISGNIVTGFSYTIDDNMTIGGNIQNPMKFNRSDDNLGPCNTTYYNMWDAQQESVAIAAAATVKTVYDPCPPGFCVPTIGVYSYIANQDRSEWNTGYTFSGVFFPASGYRSYSYNSCGALDNVGTGGYCWSATAQNVYVYSRAFRLSDSNWYLLNAFRAFGYPVRAVAEE